MNSMTTGLWGALILGLAGSLHCVGMCGPLIMALPVGIGRSSIRFWLLRFTYHTGRSSTYALFGWLVGAFGQNLKLVGWQQGISVAVGLFLVILAFWPKLQNRIPTLSFLWSALRPIQNQFFRHAGFQQQLAAGAFNALLPCGLLYTALAGAMVMSHPLYSALFMSIFGLATMPGLLILSWIKRSVRLGSFRGTAHLGTVLTLLFGIWMLLRGMGLGIPLLSPDLHNNTSKSDPIEHKHTTAPSCH